MLTTTIDIIRSALRADQTVEVAERDRIVKFLRKPEKSELAQPSPPKILHRHEVAQRLGRSLRFVDRLARNGLLRKVTIPGRKRAIGFRSGELDALIVGGTAT
jgi:hypothetical protein